MTDRTPREYLASNIQAEIESHVRLLSKLERIPIEQLKDQYPQGTWSTSWGETFEFTLPYSFELIAQVKKFMESLPQFKFERENQYVWNRDHSGPSAGFFLEYSTGEPTWRECARFQIAFRTGREGTTCVLNQIGTEVVPVFEVTCQEGANESFSTSNS